jgi:hypothetical protein
MLTMVLVVNEIGSHYGGVGSLLTMVGLLPIFLRFNLGKYFTPSHEEDKPVEKPQLKKGTVYLVKGRDVERSYTLFAEAVGQDTDGLLIVRRVPPKIKAAPNFPHVHALRLSQKEEENVLFPTQLHKMVYLISEMVNNQKNPVILLDGIEYLIVHNRFEPVLKQLYIIREVLTRHGGILLIPLDPEAFSEKELGFLEKESVSL